MTKKRAGMTTNAMIKALGGSAAANKNLALLMGSKPSEDEARKQKARDRKKERGQERKLLPYNEFLELKKYASIPTPPRFLQPDEIWIPFEVPSFKNSKEMQGKRLTHSAAVKDYIKLSEPQWRYQSHNFKAMAQEVNEDGRILHIEFTFVRATKQKFDYINMAQGPLDLMQEYGWLADDDADTVKPHFADYITADKHHAGVIIRLL
jgi:hypothetical protein